MPKKKNAETQEKQSKRFLKAVDDLEADGKLNLDEADEKFERAMGKILPPTTPNDADAGDEAKSRPEPP